MRGGEGEGRKCLGRTEEAESATGTRGGMSHTGSARFFFFCPRTLAQPPLSRATLLQRCRAGYAEQGGQDWEERGRESCCGHVAPTHHRSNAGRSMLV